MNSSRMWVEFWQKKQLKRPAHHSNLATIENQPLQFDLELVREKQWEIEASELNAVSQAFKIVLITY